MKAPLMRARDGHYRRCQVGRRIIAATVALVCAAVLPCSVFGQESWTCGSSACTTAGNVGVATTTTPVSALSVNGVLNAGGNYYNAVSYYYDGSVPSGNGMEIQTNIPFSAAMPTGYD